MTQATAATFDSIDARIATIFARTPELAERNCSPRPFALTGAEQAFLDRQPNEWCLAFALDDYARAHFHREACRALRRINCGAAATALWINRLWAESEDYAIIERRIGQEKTA